MNNMTDDDLLQMLAATFAPQAADHVEPPAERVEALRRVVGETMGPVRSGAVTMLRRGARRGSTLLAAGGLVLGGATAAAAATGHVPQPVRELAHDLGIGSSPRPHPTLSQQLGELRRAVLDHDRVKVAALVKQLNRSAKQLSNDDVSRLNSQVDAILQHEDTAPADPQHIGAAPPDESVSPPSDTSPAPPRGDGTPSDASPPPGAAPEPPTGAPPSEPAPPDTAPPVTDTPSTGSAASPPAIADSPPQGS